MQRLTADLPVQLLSDEQNDFLSRLNTEELVNI